MDDSHEKSFQLDILAAWAWIIVGCLAVWFCIAVTAYWLWP
jgi:hypothetical protein